MTDNLSLQKAYQTTNKTLRMYELNTAYLVALVLMPLGFTIDYVVYPEHFSDLGLVRTVSVVLLLATYIIYKQQKDHRYLVIFENTWSILIVFALCAMIYITGGLHSTYYAALNLIVIASTFLLPLNLKNALIVFSIALISYLATVYIQDKASFLAFILSKDLFNNLYFIILTGIIGSTASYVKEKQRFREFSLRYELDMRNKQLAEMDRIKSDFFANISHELRTPLTLILSPVEDLLQSNQPFDFKVNQLLSTVRDNSYRLLKLVNDLLSIIRLDEQNTKLESKPLEIKPLLRGIVQSMQHLAKIQQIKLETSIDFMPAVIDGNTSALEKIFINLLNNAIKFTPQNGSIIVSSKNSTEGITLIFKDTGIGISNEDLPHIFERFKQADSSATRKYQGTGLGLALVHELTLAHKGNINVESELNKGTTFTLFFPTIDAKVEKSQQKYESTENTPLESLHQKADYSLRLNKPHATILQPLPINKQKSNKRAKLIIVEDEPDLRSYLVNTLADDFHVFSAADGEEGLTLALKHKPDLALLDLMLPKKDGLQLCKEIKNNKDLSSTKVVLLTARIDETSKLSALKNGADDFLTKPFSTTEVKTRLANLWKSGQLERHLEAHNQELSQALSDLKAMESKLIHSEKLSAIGNLAAGLLHEVNNPLNYAITAVQILQRDPEIKKDSELLEMVDDIFEGMERIRIIVKDLHAFAHPGNADKEQPFILTDAIKSALRFTASEHKGISIQVTIAEDIIILGSHSHIVQVFINLISNAVKAVSETNEPRITIDAKPITPTNNNEKQERILISVSDNGCGINKDRLSQIFEPFYTTREVGEGLGMGLSICYTIIKNHSGSIDVKSEIGKYTEFSFDLALSK